MPADCVPVDPAVLPAGDLALPDGCAPPAVAGIGDPEEDWLPGLESRPAGDGVDGIDAVLPGLELGVELELELELDDDGVLLELGEEEDGIDGVLGEDEDEDDEGMELWEDC